MSKYHTVVVYVGGNDVSQRMSPNEFIQMHSDIIHFIRHKHCKVVISEILPRAVCNVNYFNSKLNHLCTFENVTYIENARFFLLPDNSVAKHLYFRDGIHLNNHGIVQLLRNYNKYVDIIDRDRIVNQC